ncbi:MAG: lipid A deacylase LpxR family protein [Verrucomicrobia bacterium]|nr:lipid A deacylase LpxR family protein [Verrucomicrobiota bacterium]MCH8512829.1 lipid A deacylase LpxR family protein [Kiritimatiellia bacterium]
MKKNINILFTISMLSLLSLPVIAGIEEFRLIFENDIFGSTDRYYTHSTRFEFMLNERNAQDQARFKPPEKILPENASYFHTLYFAQHIYTPSDLTVSERMEDDRPYAGWLYVGVATNVRISEKTENVFSVNVGLVGSSALAGQTQTEFHRWIDSQKPMGWDNQLLDEPAVDVSFVRNYRPCGRPKPGLAYDAIFSTGANIGNVFIHGKIGSVVRIGINLPDNYGPVGVPDKMYAPHNEVGSTQKSFYLFAGTEVRGVLRNIFLDGNTFRSSHSVDKKPLVVDAYCGFETKFCEKISLLYMYQIRSKEFEGQEDSHRYGTFAFSYRF